MILILLPGYLSLNIILGSLYLSLSNSKCFLNLLPHKQGQDQLLVIVKKELGLSVIPKYLNLYTRSSVALFMVTANELTWFSFWLVPINMIFVWSDLV